MRLKKNKTFLNKTQLTKKFKIDYDSVSLNVASPYKIERWANKTMPSGLIFGEVKEADFSRSSTNVQESVPSEIGLFSEQIFGPLKSYECQCGKYNGDIRRVICEVCNVELINSRVRRYRMGYINLIHPITHSWYLKSGSCYLHLILSSYSNKLKPKDIENISSFQYSQTYSNVLIEKFKTKKKINYDFACNIILNKKSNEILTRQGSEILHLALENLDLNKEINKIRLKLSRENFKIFNKFHKINKLCKKIRIFESFCNSNTKPEWLILTHLPVLPPKLRPIVNLSDSTKFASEFNDIYSEILNHTNTIKFIYSLPSKLTNTLIIKTVKELQKTVDILMGDVVLDSQKIIKPNTKPLKGLSELLSKKEGLFRHNILGKRVNYSGRGVISVNPDLKLNECSLPITIAMKIFQPLLLKHLKKYNSIYFQLDEKYLDDLIDKNSPIIFKLLEATIKNNLILLNRAPTLHKFGLQAFNVTINLGKTIELHPLVCSGFNADFDGDQMGVYVPLLETSQLEAKTLMRPTANLISPATGNVIYAPSKDMVLGNYYLSNVIINNIDKYRENSTIYTQGKTMLFEKNKKINLNNKYIIYKPCANLVAIANQNVIKVINLSTYDQLYKSNILKIFINDNKKLMYILTNDMIIIARRFKFNILKLISIFYENTRGREIINNNINKIFSKSV